MYLCQLGKIWRQLQRVRWRGSLILMGFVATVIVLQSCFPVWFNRETTEIRHLVTSERNDPNTFNSVVSVDPHAVLGLIYEGMITRNGETGELEPGIAESWTISDNKQNIILNLRSDARWSDGKPLTAEDVVFSFNDVYFNEKIPSRIQDILRIGKERQFPRVRKISDTKVEILSPEPFAPLLRYLGEVDLLPKHILEETVKSIDEEGNSKFLSAWGTNTPLTGIITNGPYRLSTYQPGQRIILESNPYYWRKDDHGKTQPYIKRVVIPIVGSSDNAMIQFRAGGLDMVNLPANFFALMKREEKRGNFTIYNGGPAPTTHFIAFNLNQGNRNGKPVVEPIKSRWFNSLKFRQAIAHAIDRPTMINNIFQGLATVHNSPIYQQSPYYLSPEEGLPVYNYNPQLARQLLEQAGFQYNNQGQLEDAEGNRVRFTLIVSNDNKIRTQIGVQFKRDLAKIGITVDLQVLAFNTFMNKLLSTLNWDAQIMSSVGDGIEPDSERQIWAVDGTLHTFNQSTFYGTPLKGRIIQDWEQKISDLYIEGSQKLDEDKRRQIYAQAQILTQEHLPFIYLVNPLSFSAIHNKVKNIRFSSLSWRLWNVYELQLE